MVAAVIMSLSQPLLFVPNDRGKAHWTEAARRRKASRRLSLIGIAVVHTQNKMGFCYVPGQLFHLQTALGKQVNSGAPWRLAPPVVPGWEPQPQSQRGFLPLAVMVAAHKQPKQGPGQPRTFPKWGRTPHTHPSNPTHSGLWFSFFPMNI